MSIIDHYEILETVSEHNGKAVYRCRDIKSQESFILKVLNSEFSKYEEVMRFKQEYRILQELSQSVPGIIKPFKLEEQNGLYFMVLEDIHGQSLKAIIENEKLPLDTVLKLVIKLVDIIGAIHEQNFIHKDIKPSNIIWNREQDVVQLIDFDLAVKLSKEKKEFQNSGVLEGSLFYISPEQTGRMNRDLDYRTDYYSLGVCLYELVTGSKPYESSEMLEQIYSIIAKELVQPHLLSNGGVPLTLSNVIMKLMEKSPDDRYRSSYGIKADLQKCLAGTDSFEVGAEDRLNVFQIPQKIYGRSRETARLVEVFRRSLRGQSQILFVSGDAGIGKTALVHELHKYISEEKGLFAEGKFDQYNKDIPYSAVIQAFRRLIGQLSESRDQKYETHLKQALTKALDGEGAIVTGLIPELEQWIGVQPEVERLNPAEETSRFFMTFAHLLQGLTDNERPLVLFLDDVHWADLSTLQLLQKLVTDYSLQTCLIICSYRSNETREGHPLHGIIDGFKKSRDIAEIELSALTKPDVEQLIGDTFYTHAAKVTELADIVIKRTKGNPFFANEFLKDLYRNGYVYFDEHKGRWSWELQRIHHLPVNDNVVDFLIEKLSTLQHEVGQTLMLSAAIGSTFEFGMLSLISGNKPAEVALSLIKAVEEDIILPADAHYSVLASVLDDSQESILQIPIRFKFQHDRIQQAFYQMLDEQTSRQLHLSIGRLLLEHLPEEEKADKILDIAAHMNKGSDFITEAAEKDRLVELNYKAALKAKSSFGYDTAYLLLGAARNLMSQYAWQDQPELTRSLYRLFAECGYLTHQVAAADDACSALLSNAVDSFAAAEIYEMQANFYFYLGLMKESIRSGRLGLEALGIKIPVKVTMVQVLAELVKVKAALRGKSPDQIFEGPQMTDPVIKLTMSLLINFIPPAFISGETSLFGYAVLKKVGLTLKYGISSESALAFIGYAMLLSGFGDLKGAFDFGRLGIRINDKFQDLQWKSGTHVLYTLFSHTWSEPWDTLQSWYKTAMEASLKTGERLYLAHACFYINLWNPTLDIGANLEETKRMIAMIETTTYKEALATAKLAKQQLLSLMGELENPLSFNGEDFNEAEYEQQLREANYYSGIAIFYIYKMKQLFMNEQYLQALEYIDKAYKIIGTLAGSAFMEEFALYTFLNLAYCYDQLGGTQKATARKRMNKEYRRVRKWAANCPENFLQHEYVMKAEWARLEGKDKLASLYYDQAIEVSERGDFIRYKALANELAAKFNSGRGQREFGAYLFKQAMYYYSVWGAKGKVKQLGEAYPEMVTKINAKEYAFGKSITDFSESIDINSMILASQAISKEIELNSLLEALMEIVIKNAGAQKGYILMRSSSNLLVEGEYQPASDKIEVKVHEHSWANHLPESILHYVEESGESLIYKDAFSETPFVNDPYIVKRRPKSLVCMPLVNQNKTIAIIYMENNLVTGAFTKERMKMINLLSREMVFSLENASLYSNLEKSEEKYRELVNNMQDGLFIIQDGICVYANPAMASMVGYELEEMIGKPADRFVCPEDKDKLVYNYISRTSGESFTPEYEAKLQYKNNSHEVIVLLKATVILFLNKPAVQGTVKDITVRKKAEEELRRHKEHLEELVVERTRELEINNQALNQYIELIEKISITDELTGLYNRRHFNPVFQNKVEEASRTTDYLTYIMLDIDHYKKYNDTYGHYEGDEVLRRLSRKIKDIAEGAGGLVFRLGGEEFGLIFNGMNLEASRNMAEEIRSSVEDMHIIHELSMFGVVTVSVGVAVVKGRAIEEKDLYKLADEALYQSKSGGRNRVTLLQNVQSTMV